jgi:hypothetical protein
LHEIDIYDNGAIGLCLWHTEDMQKRVLESFTKGVNIGIKEGESKIIEQIINNTDLKAINDPNEFKKWLKRHGL